MKKLLSVSVLSVFVMAMLIFGTSQVNAQTTPTNDVKDMVIKAIDYPENAIDKKLEGEVVVKFTPSGTGKIEVNEIYSRVPELQEYVYETISSMEVPQSHNEALDPITLRFTFKLI